MLVDGDVTSWPIGAAVVFLAVLVSLLAGKPTSERARLGRLLRFFPYFIGRSVVGAIDVGRRAYDPDIDLDAAFHEYPLRLSTERGRVFFANAVSLLPGTLSAELRSRHLLVHVLDRRQPFTQDLASLEEKVAQLFGQNLNVPKTAE